MGWIPGQRSSFQSLHVLHCVCMASLQVPSSHSPNTSTLGWLATLNFVWRCECERLFVSGRGPVINWPLVSDTVSEPVTENRRRDGIQSSLADIVFARHCSLFSSCLSSVLFEVNMPLVFGFRRLNWPCRSSYPRPCRQGSWPALSTQLPCAPWHLDPWHCGCRQVPLPSFRVRWSTRRSSGPPRGRWGPHMRPLFSLLTDNEPETDLVSKRGTHLAERAEALSWSGGDKTADLLRDDGTLCSGRSRRRVIVSIRAVQSREIAQILLQTDISAPSDSWKP